VSQVVCISAHVTQRYQERVDRSASSIEARLAVMQIASLGKARCVPRHWMRGDVEPSPGLTFVVWSQRPDLCLLVRDGIVVTLITRAMCAAAPKRHLAAIAGGGRRPMTADVARWRWSGMLDEAAA
jgi:hypothetical protein